MNKDYKVGDLITITKSSRNWTPSMDKYIGNTYLITYICRGRHFDNISIKFEGDGGYTWTSRENHFRRASYIETRNYNLVNNTKKEYDVIKDVDEKIEETIEERVKTVKTVKINKQLLLV